MRDIELVIKIPEEIYKASQILDVKYEDTIQIPLEVIANGISLPKGHGRLIDADAVEKEMNKSEVEADRNADYYTADKIDCAMEYIIDAETIIEEDKESEDKG